MIGLRPACPRIEDDTKLSVILTDISRYLIQITDTPYSFEELRLKEPGRMLDSLTRYLVTNVHHSAVVCALLALKGHFSGLEEDDNRHLNQTRGAACEVLAWRFTTYLSEAEAIDYLLYELPPVTADPDEPEDDESFVGTSSDTRSQSQPQSQAISDENTPLINNQPPETPKRVNRGLGITTDENTSLHNASPSISFVAAQVVDLPSKDDEFAALAMTLGGLNALEIAAVVEAKDFLSQPAVQRLINGIWKGDIVFWTSLSVHAKKKARKYNRNGDDPFCRLRVPRYVKFYEVVFFAVFLALYYYVLVQRNADRMTTVEVFLLIWLTAFAYDEFGQYWDAGLAFYAADFWSAWDFGIILIGAAYFVTRVVGLVTHNARTTDIAFDILSLEALLLVPRSCSLLSLHPFFGPLIPCLKEMTKYSAQFLGLVAILYVGFLTTFTLLARDHFTPVNMSWILIKVFFGSSYLGFDVAQEISPILGAPLMLIFVFLSNILLLTALISLLSNSLAEVMSRSREEYLFVYSVFVLEASTSNRLTYYMPPLNLLSLLFRPLRLFVSSEKLRGARITLLKITHFPLITIIWGLERLVPARRRQDSRWSAPIGDGGESTKMAAQNNSRVSRLASASSPLRRVDSNRRPPLATSRSSDFAVTKRHSSTMMMPTTARKDDDTSAESIGQLHAKIDRLQEQVEQLVMLAENNRSLRENDRTELSMARTD